jgi:chromate reductase, NAD(P)H dehydrogenase (quinone)
MSIIDAQGLCQQILSSDSLAFRVDFDFGVGSASPRLGLTLTCPLRCCPIGLGFPTGEGAKGFYPYGMRILALCGSLRKQSRHAALLRVMQTLSPAEVTFDLFQGMGSLPLFNPDLEAEYPQPVLDLYREVESSPIVLIASPEYAHGVTGTMKNALDWLVGFEPFVYKPVILINASPRAIHSDAALRETLTTMSARLLPSASMTLPVLGTGLDESGMRASPVLAQAIEGLFQHALREFRDLNDPLA